jgi:TusA-related sulfurtransferase
MEKNSTSILSMLDHRYMKADKTLDVQSVLDTAIRLRITERTLQSMRQGQILKVILPNGAAKQDVTRFCLGLGYTIHETDETGENPAIAVQV